VLTASNDPNLLIGFENADDAAVYRLTDEIAMIHTIDFITPPVDDPYWFGQIAAANSISDIYSMGGIPLTALNVVMFPSKILDMGVLKEILRGGNDKVIEAGASLVGGHSVDDEEPKFGLCVNGKVHPEKILTNKGAQPGDALILTKPLGTGVLFNAVRSNKFDFKNLESLILPSVAALNKNAIEAALDYPINACTDITGFGIIGHCLEVAKASAVEIRLSFNSLPIYPGALEMYQKGETTGSNKGNKKLSQDFLRIQRKIKSPQKEILFDPQTSGGLLFSLPELTAQKLLESLHLKGIHDARIIGKITQGLPQIIIE